MNATELTFAKRFDGITGSAIREILKLMATPGMISFGGGNPASSALPEDTVSRLCQKVLRENGKNILQYGTTEGYAPLKESLAPYLMRQFGFEVKPEDILPVSGSSQAMDLLCKALINPGDVILVENPTFLGNMQCMRLYQACVVPVESDEGGLCINKLEEAIIKHHPKMVYTIPTFQNPTGKTLAAERRPQIAELAGKYGFVVAEDDPYRDLRYSGTPLPSIKSYDKSGLVVFLGSFSKLISPGLRVGYIAAHPNILRKCVIGKQSADVHTATLNQAVVDAFFREDLLDSHVASICKSYRLQLHAMLEELSDFPEGTRYTRPEGGLFVWAELPEGINATALLMKAVERKVAYVPGSHFFAQGGHENTMRLNFSNSPIEKIHEGMAILKQVILEAMQ